MFGPARSLLFSSLLSSVPSSLFSLHPLTLRGHDRQPDPAQLRELAHIARQGLGLVQGLDRVGRPVCLHPPPFPSSPEAGPPLRALEGRAASARTGPRLSARCGFAGALVLFSAPRPRAARPGVEVHGAAARPEERSCQPATRACPVSTGGGTRRV